MLSRPVPGYKTGTCNNLRLWGSKAASGEFDFQKFNSGEYESSVADQQRAETISAVLYPNDKYVFNFEYIACYKTDCFQP
jgi:starch phosphorylase